VARNITLALSGIAALFLPDVSDNSIHGISLLVAGTAYFLYEGVEQALSNQQGYQLWVHNGGRI
jgi:hypothetical protein